MVFASANLSLQLLERLVPPETTSGSLFFSLDENMDNDMSQNYETGKRAK